MNNQFSFTVRNPEAIRQALLARKELVLVNVRKETPFATAHPLFAVNIPLSRLEIEVGARIPRFTTPITLYDNGEGLALAATQRHQAMGYTDVALLKDGLAGKSARAIADRAGVQRIDLPLLRQWQSNQSHPLFFRCAFAGRVPSGAFSRRQAGC